MSNYHIGPIDCRHADGGKMFVDYNPYSKKFIFQARIVNYWWLTHIDEHWGYVAARAQAKVDFMLIKAGKTTEATPISSLPDYGPLPW